MPAFVGSAASPASRPLPRTVIDTSPSIEHQRWRAYAFLKGWGGRSAAPLYLSAPGLVPSECWAMLQYLAGEKWPFRSYCCIDLLRRPAPSSKRSTNNGIRGRGPPPLPLYPRALYHCFQCMARRGYASDLPSGSRSAIQALAASNGASRTAASGTDPSKLGRQSNHRRSSGVNGTELFSTRRSP